MKTTELQNKLNNLKTRSAWDKGIKEYAYMLLQVYEDNHIEEITKEDIKNIKQKYYGVGSWLEISYSGSLLCYDEDIARTLCTPSELKRTDNGRLAPNRHESWLGCQARAAWQAQRLLLLLF